MKRFSEDEIFLEQYKSQDIYYIKKFFFDNFSSVFHFAILEIEDEKFAASALKKSVIQHLEFDKQAHVCITEKFEKSWLLLNTKLTIWYNNNRDELREVRRKMKGD